MQLRISAINFKGGNICHQENARLVANIKSFIVAWSVERLPARKGTVLLTTGGGSPIRANLTHKVLNLIDVSATCGLWLPSRRIRMSPLHTSLSPFHLFEQWGSAMYNWLKLARMGGALLVEVRFNRFDSRLRIPAKVVWWVYVIFRSEPCEMVFGEIQSYIARRWSLSE